MYQRLAERRGWKVDIISVSEGIPGSIKEAILEVRGAGAYGRLRYESGVHRVQRVPATEASGRIHTSAATVAVLPEVEELRQPLTRGIAGHVASTGESVRIDDASRDQHRLRLERHVAEVLEQNDSVPEIFDIDRGDGQPLRLEELGDLDERVAAHWLDTARGEHASIAAFASWTGLAYRWLKLMPNQRSRAAASASSMSACSRSKTSGFSTSSGTPARMIASVVSKWSASCSSRPGFGLRQSQPSSGPCGQMTILLMRPPAVSTSSWPAT